MRPTDSVELLNDNIPESDKAQNIIQFVFCLQLLPLSCFLLPVIAAYLTYILVYATFTIATDFTLKSVHFFQQPWGHPSGVPTDDPLGSESLSPPELKLGHQSGS